MTTRGRDPANHYKPRCRTCGTTWTGQAVCHCGACHESFTSLSAFDAHQIGEHCARIRENQGGNTAQLVRADGRKMPLIRSGRNLWHYPGREPTP